ncbi:hypothetical protein GLV94_13695 [Virgibacillus halodenitrificans]|uniref:hypothetical protein n=1 Tax=Virgibacillus halodenitrificans TaxID=1482 RepID=UPI0013680C21|nr:hypothetical protein [Virgibacillus halodenitrificans]MYL46698.1 hypothetical protein [Virgibacillus halodenitrificans]
MEIKNPYKTVICWVGDYHKKQKLEVSEFEYITPREHKNREKELLDQIKDLEEENAILKKAVSIFMRNKE